jgi:hypothetical protein
MAYKGMRDCFFRVLKEEGIGAFYLSLPPRLMAVVPMIAIQVNYILLIYKFFLRLVYSYYNIFLVWSIRRFTKKV